MFVQLYASGEDAVKSQVATFFDVFPDGVVFGNTDASGRGYDVVLLGQRDPAPLPIDDIQARLGLPEYARVAGSLREVGFGSAFQLFSTYAARAGEMQAWLQGAELNRDRNLRLQYLAGLGLNLHEEATIYAHMTQAWRYPDDLFSGNAESVRLLKSAMRAR